MREVDRGRAPSRAASSDVSRSACSDSSRVFDLVEARAGIARLAGLGDRRALPAAPSSSPRWSPRNGDARRLERVGVGGRGERRDSVALDALGLGQVLVRGPSAASVLTACGGPVDRSTGRPANDNDGGRTTEVAPPPCDLTSEATYAAFSAARALSASAANACGIAHGEVGEDLSVDFDAGLLRARS